VRLKRLCRPRFVIHSPKRGVFQSLDEKLGISGVFVNAPEYSPLGEPDSMSSGRAGWPAVKTAGIRRVCGFAVWPSRSKARAPGIAKDRQHWRGIEALCHGFPTDLSTDSVDKSGFADN
jgi:hypothetical protein